MDVGHMRVAWRLERSSVTNTYIIYDTYCILYQCQCVSYFYLQVDSEIDSPSSSTRLQSVASSAVYLRSRSPKE